MSTNAFTWTSKGTAQGQSLSCTIKENAKFSHLDVMTKEHRKLYTGKKSTVNCLNVLHDFARGTSKHCFFLWHSPIILC